MDKEKAPKEKRVSQMKAAVHIQNSIQFLILCGFRPLYALHREQNDHIRHDSRWQIQGILSGRPVFPFQNLWTLGTEFLRHNLL